MLLYEMPGTYHQSNIAQLTMINHRAALAVIDQMDLAVLPQVVSVIPKGHGRGGIPTEISGMYLRELNNPPPAQDKAGFVHLATGTHGMG